MSTTATASAYQTLSVALVYESQTNPRRTFDPDKLAELAESIRTHGLIQPITVRPVEDRFEIVAGARRFRATQIAGQESIVAIVRDLTDQQALEVQLIENAQRQDVHPYEEATGYERVLQLPGYDVAAVASKTGKSQSHVYARLALLQLIPEVAEAFQHDRITASHANLLARLPEPHQKDAFQQCWRKDYQDKEPHLMPAKHLSAWIQDNLYLPLGEAPFSTDDPVLNAEAGPCTTCPRRSGYNTQLFADVEGDQCLDAPCYHSKVSAHIDRELAARPELVQIETSWHNPKDRRPGALGNNQWRHLPTPENTDAEPPCASTRTAIVVFGRSTGKTVSVCIDNDCPIHDPQRAAYRAAHPVPVMEPPTEEETEEEAAARKAEYDQRQADYKAQQERKEAEAQAEQERRDKEYEAERERRERQQKKREASFQRILQTTPAQLNPGQLRVILRALVNMDPYTFADDLAAQVSKDPDNDRRSAEEVLLTAIDGLADDKLTGFAVHLALAGHRAIPRENELDILTEAEAVFLPKDTPKAGKGKAAKQPAKATANTAQKAPAKKTEAKATGTKTKAKKAPQTSAKA